MFDIAALPNRVVCSLHAQSFKPDVHIERAMTAITDTENVVVTLLTSALQWLRA
jgi:hypothetical protein